MQEALSTRWVQRKRSAERVSWSFAIQELSNETALRWAVQYGHEEHRMVCYDQTESDCLLLAVATF